MVLSKQIRAARALLGWSQDELAGHANIGIATVKRLERDGDPMRGSITSLRKIEAALAEAGIAFLSDHDQIGVVLRAERRVNRLRP